MMKLYADENFPKPVVLSILFNCLYRRDSTQEKHLKNVLTSD
jgi:hypothetical protein